MIYLLVHAGSKNISQMFKMALSTYKKSGEVVLVMIRQSLKVSSCQHVR